MNKSDLKERIFFLRGLKRKAADIPVRAKVFEYLLETLKNEEDSYKVQMEKLRLEAIKMEARRRRDKERRRLRKLAKQKAKEEAMLASEKDNSSDESDEEGESESGDDRDEGSDEGVKEKKGKSMAKFYLKNMLDLDMCDEGWTVIEPTFFVIPGIFDVTKCKQHPGVNDLLSSGENDQPLKSTETTKLQWYVEDISIFRALETVNVWRKLFSTFHANCRERISAKLQELRHKREMREPGGITEEAQFLKEAEEAAATGEGRPQVGDLVGT